MTKTEKETLGERMDPSDEFVLIDNINGTVYTMEQNELKGPKSVEIELYRIQYGEHIVKSHTSTHIYTNRHACMHTCTYIHIHIDTHTIQI